MLPPHSRLPTFGSAIPINPKSASEHRGNPSALPAHGSAILQVIPALDAGGAERTTVDVAAALAREGFQPLVASQGGRMATELVISGGELIQMKLDTKAPHALVANAYRLRDLIRTRNVALVHARSRAPAWSALWAARMAHVPFVTTYHGIYNASNPLKRFYNSVMARADAVIANSQWTAARYPRAIPFRAEASDRHSARHRSCAIRSRRHPAGTRRRAARGLGGEG